MSTADDIKAAASGETDPGALSQAATLDSDITAVLAHLDPKNDTHWTSDGKPAMDALNALLKAPITRKRLEEVAPDFRRPSQAPAQMPAGAIGTWVAPPSTDERREDGYVEGDQSASDQAETLEQHILRRLDALEADNAFLRNQFGWPTKDA